MRTQRRPTLSRPLAALAVVIGSSTLSAPIAAAADTAEPDAISWSVEAASADGPDGRVSLWHEIEPGATVQDFITITNASAVSAGFLIYASDGIISPSGDFDILRSDEPPQDGGSWIRVTDPSASAASDSGRLTVDVPASSSLTLPVTISVPQNATPGDHAAGVVAELAPGDEQGFRAIFRVGVRVHLRLAGDIVAAIQPTIIRTQWAPSWNPFAPGTLLIDYEVKNEGNVRIGATARTTVSGPWGILAASDSTDVREILPGDSAPVATQVTVWPTILGFGAIDLSAMVVGDDRVSDLPRKDVSFEAVTMPWSQLILLLAIAAIVVIARTLVIRSRKRVQPRIDAAVAAATACSTAPALTPDAEEASPVDAGSFHR